MYQNAIGAQHMRTTEDRRPRAARSLSGRAAVLCEGVSRIPAGGGVFHENRVKTDYQFGEPFTIWDERQRESALAESSGQDPAVLLRLQPHRDARESDLPVEPGAQGQAARHRSRAGLSAARTIRTRRSCARSWRASTTTSPTWMVRSAQILQELEADGLAENTIVFYWSRSRRRRSARQTVAVRLGSARAADDPLAEVLAAPFAPGTVSDELVSFVDLAPTVLAIAGVTIPAHLQGRVLVGPRAGPPPPIRLCRARSHGPGVRHDAVGPRRRFLYIRNLCRCCRTPATSSIATRAPSCRSGSGCTPLDSSAARRRCGCARIGRPRSCSTCGRTRTKSATSRRARASRHARAHAPGRRRLDGPH